MVKVIRNPTTTAEISEIAYQHVFNTFHSALPTVAPANKDEASLLRDFTERFGRLEKIGDALAAAQKKGARTAGELKGSLISGIERIKRDIEKSNLPGNLLNARFLKPFLRLEELSTQQPAVAAPAGNSAIDQAAEKIGEEFSRMFTQAAPPPLTGKGLADVAKQLIAEGADPKRVAEFVSGNGSMSPEEAYGRLLEAEKTHGNMFHKMDVDDAIKAGKDQVKKTIASDTGWASRIWKEMSERANTNLGDDSHQGQGMRFMRQAGVWLCGSMLIGSFISIINQQINKNDKVPEEVRNQQFRNTLTTMGLSATGLAAAIFVGGGKGSGRG